MSQVPTLKSQLVLGAEEIEPSRAKGAEITCQNCSEINKA